MEMNFYWFLIAGLVPVVVGMVWYNPKVLGNAWMKTAGLTEEQLKGGNMWILLLLTYIFGVFVSFAIFGGLFHQSGMFSILANDPAFTQEGSEAYLYFQEFMSKYGTVNRDFGHGAFHGILSGVLFAFPIIGMLSIYERRGWKYTGIHTGFWIVCLAIIGGLLAQFI